MIVEIPLVPYDPIRRPQKLGGNFFRRRLARATCDRYDLRPRLPPHALRKRLQRFNQVGNFQYYCWAGTSKPAVAPPFNDYASGAGRKRLADKIRSVEPLSSNRDEQLTGGQRPRIDRNAGELTRSLHRRRWRPTSPPPPTALLGESPMFRPRRL